MNYETLFKNVLKQRNSIVKRGRRKGSYMRKDNGLTRMPGYMQYRDMNTPSTPSASTFNVRG